MIARLDLSGIVARDEDDRHVIPVESEGLLEFETSEVRKIHVKDQAPGAGLDQWVSQELLCGPECLRLANQRIRSAF